MSGRRLMGIGGYPLGDFAGLTLNRSWEIIDRGTDRVESLQVALSLYPFSLSPNGQQGRWAFSSSTFSAQALFAWITWASAKNADVR